VGLENQTKTGIQGQSQSIKKMNPKKGTKKERFWEQKIEQNQLVKVIEQLGKGGRRKMKKKKKKTGFLFPVFSFLVQLDAVRTGQTNQRRMDTHRWFMMP
jgi:hypothetical protein